MSGQAVVDRSALRLSEVARHVVIPEGIVDTLWPEVVEVCNELGDEFDVWQDGLGQVALGLREDDTFAATVGGVVLSIPRQVAKTFIVGRIVFALCVLFPGLNAIWTAHRVSTANSAFRSVAALARRPGASRYVEKILTGDELTIVFRNGSILRFGARAQNFGRGETQVDVEVFDEAQILRADTLEDMVPAANQAKIPHGALLFFMGTPPRPKDDGEEFTQRRDDALADKPTGSVVLERGDMVYVECGADPSCGRPGGPDLMDRAQIEKANPSFPKRTPWISILRMRRNLKDDDSWRREALGIWDESSGTQPLIPAVLWRDCHVEIAPPTGVQTYGVKFSADGSRVALAGARRPDDGPTHVEVIKSESTASGTGWLADWLAERWRKAAVIVIDGKSGAAVLVTELRKRGVPASRMLCPTAPQVIEAHAGFLEAVRTKALTHYGQTGLDDVVKAATKRPVGDKAAGGWAWAPIGDDIDVTPLDAVTYAHYGATTTKRRPTGDGGRSSSGRRVEVA